MFLQVIQKLMLLNLHVTYFNKSCPENKYKKSFYIFFFDFPCIIGNKVVPLANI